MKVIKKEIRECKFEDGTETIVLELHYIHKEKGGKILVKDYDDKNYEAILKQLKKAVKQHYLDNK